MMSVDFGLSLPAGPPKGQISRFTEDLDALLPRLSGHFRSMWMTDHFFWEDNPTHEAWTVLAFLAGRYPDWELGPMVLGQSYRNPALLAKQAATLQALSNGRFIMAIGAGWKEDEYHAYGYPYPRPGIRVAQLRDTLEILKRMWTEPGKVSYQGRHYHIKDAYCEPKPDPPPPILVGGAGKKTMMLAARYADWWNMPDAPLAGYSARMAILDQHCETIGRDPATIRRTWFGRLAVGKTQAEAEARSNGKWTVSNALCGTVPQVVEQIQQFVAAGVDYFMVEVLDLSDPDVLGMVLEEVLPGVRLD